MLMGCPFTSNSGVTHEQSNTGRLEPAVGAHSQVLIRTSVDGFQDTWKAVLDRFFAKFDGAVRIQINDAGATPGSVQLRLEQAVEVLGS